MASEKIDLDKNGMFGTGLTHETQNICSEVAIKANFHFSHYKSIET